MRRLKPILIHAVALLTVALCVNIARAEPETALAGKWNMVSTTQDGNDIAWSLSITFKDGTYGATLVADEGESTPKELKVDGSKVHMRVPYHGDEYDIDLKLAEGKLEGTWSGGGDSGKTKGQRAAQ